MGVYRGVPPYVGYILRTKCVRLERGRDCEYYDGHRRGNQSSQSPPPNIGDARELLTDDNVKRCTQDSFYYLIL